MARKVRDAVTSAWVCPWCKHKHLIGLPRDIRTCSACKRKSRPT